MRNILNLSTDERIEALLADNLPTITSKSITFTGAANLGAIGNVPIFTVTGQILVVNFVPFSILTLVGATATLALGVTGSTSLFIAATTATGITTGTFWVSTSPTANGIAIPAAMHEIAVGNNIVGTVAVAAITGGTIRFDLEWVPLSSDAAVS